MSQLQDLSIAKPTVEPTLGALHPGRATTRSSSDRIEGGKALAQEPLWRGRVTVGAQIFARFGQPLPPPGMMRFTTADGKPDQTYEAPRDLSSYAAYLILQLATQRQILLDVELKPLGMTYAVWRPLAFIHAAGQCSMVRLSRVSGIDRTTLTRVIDRLVAEGYVLRGPSAADRRMVVLNLTPKGEEAYELGSEVQQRADGGLMGEMPNEDQAKFCQTLINILSRVVSSREILLELLNPHGYLTEVK